MWNERIEKQKIGRFRNERPYNPTAPLDNGAVENTVRNGPTLHGIRMISQRFPTRNGNFLIL